MKAIQHYVFSVALVAFISVLLVDWGTLSLLTPSQWVGTLSLIGLGLVSECLALTITVERNSGNTSITFLPLLTVVLLFGPEAGVLVAAVSGGVGETLIRRKRPIRVIFNISQWIVATVLAGTVFDIMGGTGVSLTTLAFDIRVTDQIAPLLSYGVVFLFLNHGAVSIAIALSSEVPLSHAWKGLVGPSGSNILYDMLVGPVAIAVAFFYMSLGLLGLIVSLLPLLFVRHSYLTNLQLQKANRDLLTALVKAIETRDPYTSGHSMRVSDLAKRIAIEMNLSTRKVDAIETAALLHDIGKIDSVYATILKKPDNLTVMERRIIESHVTKGVELLESLSSFSADVIGAVRHHHERVDGRGYPSGLHGDGIPLGARIIRVSDAIDAMLSDRPYRNALELADVKDQLLKYRDSQFDRSIVDHVIASDILHSHSRKIGRQSTSSHQALEEPDVIGASVGHKLAPHST